jgi:hypothetical protein
MGLSRFIKKDRRSCINKACLFQSQENEHHYKIEKPDISAWPLIVIQIRFMQRP